MGDERRTAVLVSPTRVYSNPNLIRRAGRRSHGTSRTSRSWATVIGRPVPTRPGLGDERLLLVGVPRARQEMGQDQLTDGRVLRQRTDRAGARVPLQGSTVDPTGEQRLVDQHVCVISQQPTPGQTTVSPLIATTPESLLMRIADRRLHRTVVDQDGLHRCRGSFVDEGRLVGRGERIDLDLGPARVPERRCE